MEALKKAETKATEVSQDTGISQNDIEISQNDSGHRKKMKKLEERKSVDNARPITRSKRRLEDPATDDNVKNKRIHSVPVVSVVEQSAQK